jgi:hypothetical protein
MVSASVSTACYGWRGIRRRPAGHSRSRSSCVSLSTSGIRWTHRFTSSRRTRPVSWVSVPTSSARKGIGRLYAKNLIHTNSAVVSSKLYLTELPSRRWTCSTTACCHFWTRRASRWSQILPDPKSLSTAAGPCTSPSSSTASSRRSVTASRGSALWRPSERLIDSTAL